MGNWCIKPTENIEPSRTGADLINPVEKITDQNNKSVEIIPNENPFSPEQEDFVHL
jgi:hypothetical protein